MPAAQTLPAQQGTQASPAPASVPAVPFAQASHHGCEQGPTWTVTPGASQQTLQGTLPATGYLRRVLLEVTSASGAGAATGAGDFPFNLFANIRLSDTNGAPIFELSGYNTLLADTYGGYAGCPDPRVDPDYANTAANPVVEPYIPLELDPTGMGSPANLSASSAYRLVLVVDTSANIWTSAPATTIPTFTVQAWCEYWTLPNPTDMQGRPQAVAPPFAGTLQLWSQQPNIGVNAGANRIALNRMGNLLRTVIAVFRSSGARSDSVVGDPISLRWDDINLDVVDRKTIRKRMREYTNDLVQRDTGVYLFGLYNYGLERNVGGNSVVSWLPTVTATRYEISSPAGSGAGGTLDFVVNDVSVAATAPEQRATVGGTGVGFHPPVAPVVPGAN